LDEIWRVFIASKAHALASLYMYIYVRILLYAYNDLLQEEDRMRLCQKCIDPAAYYACTNIYRRRILLYKAPAEIHLQQHRETTSTK